MEATITPKPAMRFVGLATTLTLAEVQAAHRPTYALACRFTARQGEIPLCSHPQVVVGLSTDPEDYQVATDRFEYFIGVEVSSLTHIPAGMVVRAIPAHTYVKFTFRGTADQAGTVHRYFYTTWLKQQAYELDGRYNLEIYDERHHGPESATSVTDLYFPIRSQSTNAHP